MVEVGHSGKSMEQRAADRLKPSGDTENADHLVQKGEGPTRLRMEVHHSRVHAWGDKDTEPEGERHD